MLACNSKDVYHLHSCVFRSVLRLEALPMEAKATIVGLESKKRKNDELT